MRLRWNPVLRREALERWRGRRAMWVLTVYLSILGGVLYGLYRLGRTILASQVGGFIGGGFGDAQGAASGPLLGRFLDRPRIYLTEHFFAHYEQQARQNLQRTLNAIETT